MRLCRFDLTVGDRTVGESLGESLSTELAGTAGVGSDADPGPTDSRGASCFLGQDGNGV